MGLMTPTPLPSGAPGESQPDPSYASRVLGVLAGGAAGDALGYTVEFSSLDQIRARFGDAGLAHRLQVPEVRDGGTLPVSDNTQMTLFVLDGLLEWIEWANEGTMADPAACVWLSCLRWYRTQEGTLPAGVPEPPSRWLDGHPELRVRRAPGNACLSGLAQSDMGLPAKPHNPGSKGCGTVMRSAPYGMVPGLEDELVVSLARQGAVLTHGQDSAAWTVAAAFGLMVSRLMAEHGFGVAVADALDWLQTVPDDGGTADALGCGGGDGAGAGRAARGPAHRIGRGLGGRGGAGAGRVRRPGDLRGICAGTDPSTHFQSALRLAINHDGDSDSTGSLAGQLLGARYGMSVFPGAEAPRWVAERDVVVEAAERWIAATS